MEIIKMDGVGVEVFASESAMRRARDLAMGAMGIDESQADAVLPEWLTLIESSAFEGIEAAIVEVTENVAAIEARAFAECKHLREISIPSTVLKIDDCAFDGCEGLTVYGTPGTEAARIASLYGFAFVDTSAKPEDAPIELPFVPVF